MADFTIKQGDATTFAYTLDGAPNVTGHTVNFVMRALTSNSPVINTAATLVTPASGAVSYTFSTTDSATAGIFQASFVDTTANVTYPTTGYLTIVIEENLTTVGGASIVALGDVKDTLNIPATSRTYDAELLRMIAGVTPVVENLAGKVLQTTFDEWYDGGQYWIKLRHRPVINLIAVSEYRGPIEYSLAVVQDPAHGTIYSAMLDNYGRVVRRSAGGGVIAFPRMPNSVHVVYLAGQTTVPENIREGTLEIIRTSWQQTQQGGRPQFGTGGSAAADDLAGQLIQGYYVTPRARELLVPNRRHPSLA